MAVIQISRIQIRRGTVNGTAGFPQLASGEMGWAIDTQELYIGNGSVFEGAPAVGNTKILTEKDLYVNNNMLTLINHIYKSSDTSISTGPSPNTPIARSLQDRLDDRVTSTDFGTSGNYDDVALTGNNDTDALQRAINELFLNDANAEAYNTTVDGVKARVILELPAGRFKITDTINIPSYATIVGAGADKTIIDLVSRTIVGSVTLNNKTIVSTTATTDMVGCAVTGTGIPEGTIIDSVIPGTSFHITHFPTATNAGLSLIVSSVGPVFRFVNDTSIPGSPNVSATQGITQPRNIIIKGMTLRTEIDNITCLSLESVKNSVFEDLNIQGNTFNAISDNGIGIYMDVTGMALTEQNSFNRVNVSGFTYGMYSQYDIINNTFTNCIFDNVTSAASLGNDAILIGQTYGPRNTIFLNCQFSNVRQIAIYIEHGTGNVIENAKFINVGNNGGSFAQIAYPQIYLGDVGNTTKGIVSDRSLTISDPKFRSKVVTLTLSEPITAPKGAIVVQAVSEANGNLANVAYNSSEIDVIVTDDNQIFNTTNNLTINSDSTPGDLGNAVHPTDVSTISEGTPFIPYIAEVAGHGVYQSPGANQLLITPVQPYVTADLFKLPINLDQQSVPYGSMSHTVNYVYTSFRTNGTTRFVRRGTLFIVSNFDALNPEPFIHISDDYDYVGEEQAFNGTRENVQALKLQFSSRIVEVTDTEGNPTSYTIVVGYTNLLANDNGTFVYSYTSTF